MLTVLTFRCYWTSMADLFNETHLNALCISKQGYFIHFRLAVLQFNCSLVTANVACGRAVKNRPL